MKPTVLIVEDDANSNRLWHKALLGAGFQAISAYSVSEACHALSGSCVPDFIILDLVLSDGCGTQVLDTLQGTRFARTQVIVVSGQAYTTPFALESYPILYTLLKPVSPRGLVSLLHTCT